MKQNTDTASDGAACSVSLRVPVTLWAEIGDDRIEREYFVMIPLPDGHCPDLAKSLTLKATAQHLHGMMIKTGVSFIPNAIGEARADNATSPQDQTL
jgi:hypothetical protein